MVTIADPVVRAHWKQFQRRRVTTTVLVAEYEEQIEASGSLEDFT